MMGQGGAQALAMGLGLGAGGLLDQPFPKRESESLHGGEREEEGDRASCGPFGDTRQRAEHGELPRMQ